MLADFRQTDRPGVGLKLTVSVLALTTWMSASGAYGQTAPCVDGAFGNVNNAGTASGAGTPFGSVSLSASQASTAQVLQTVSERRQQEAKICPAGFQNSGSGCVPMVDEVDTEQATAMGGGEASQTANTGSSPQQQSSSGGQSNGSPSSGSSTASPSAENQAGGSTSPEYYQSAQGSGVATRVWTEVYYDYEERSNLPGSRGQAFDREKETVGLFSGIEQTRGTSNQSITFGGLAGYSQIDLDFSSSQISGIDQFGFELNYLVNPGGAPAVRTLTFNSPFSVVATTTQKLDGASLGMYGSYRSAGYFFDLLGKVDQYDFKQKTVSVATGSTGVDPASVATLLVTPNSIDRSNGATGGCIDSTNTFANDLDGNGVVNAQDFLLESRTTTTTRTIDSSVTYLTIGSTMGKRFDRPGGWWVEPAFGINYTFASFGDNAEILGVEDGHALRIRGGATVGGAQLIRSGMAPVLWNNSFGTFLYSDVFIDGFVRNGNGFSPAAVEADEGKLRVEGIFRTEFDFLNGTLAYGEVNGRGGEDLWAVGGKLGMRFEF